MSVTQRFKSHNFLPGPDQEFSFSHALNADLVNGSGVYFLRGRTLAQVMDLLWNTKAVRFSADVDFYRPYCSTGGTSWDQIEIIRTIDYPFTGSTQWQDGGATTYSDTAPEPYGRVCFPAAVDEFSGSYIGYFEQLLERKDDGAYNWSLYFGIDHVYYVTDTDSYAVRCGFRHEFWTVYYYPLLTPPPTRVDITAVNDAPPLIISLDSTQGTRGVPPLSYYLLGSASGDFLGDTVTFYFWKSGSTPTCGTETFTGSASLSVDDVYTYA